MLHWLYITGFSKQIIQILNEQSVKFSTFDILQDEEVRQGIIFGTVLDLSFLVSY